MLGALYGDTDPATASSRALGDATCRHERGRGPQPLSRHYLDPRVDLADPPRTPVRGDGCRGSVAPPTGRVHTDGERGRGWPSRRPREQVAGLLGRTAPREVVYTSGATEAVVTATWMATDRGLPRRAPARRAPLRSGRPRPKAPHHGGSASTTTVGWTLRRWSRRSSRGRRSCTSSGRTTRSAPSNRWPTPSPPAGSGGCSCTSTPPRPPATSRSTSWRSAPTC
jgi:hypothetical protein